MRSVFESRSALPTLALSLLALASLGAVAGCGSSTTVQPDAAWVVNFFPGNTTPSTCITNANFSESFGQVTPAVIDGTLNNGQTDTADTGNPAAVVTCSVTGTTTFAVNAQASTIQQNLTISIPSISKSATESNPATGTASYESAAHTADAAYQGSSCNFYFKSGTNEAVAAGKIWGAFSCASVTSTGGDGDMCGIEESYFVFENCGM